MNGFDVMTPGVGVLLNGAIDAFLMEHPEAVDYVSIIPERFWNDLGRNARTRFVSLPEEVDLLTRISRNFPLVAHGVGLSIGSASTFDIDHVRQLRSWHDTYKFNWISEHLSAVRVSTEITDDHHAGLALPMPWDYELLDLLCDRINAAQDILGSRLFFENGVIHTPVPYCDLSEAAFLNAMVDRTGCGILLDLHNLYVNSVNLHDDPIKFLEELNLAAVGEIHVAGGNEMFGVYLDSHAGSSPREVWSLLEFVTPRCTELAGVTFEFHESYFPDLGVAGVLLETQKIRTTLTRSSGAMMCPSVNFSAPLPH